MSKKKKSKGDVQYYLPGKERPIAYSTVAVNDELVIFAQEGMTIYQLYNALIYSPDARCILQKYIDAGFGNEKANTFFQ